MTLEPDYSLEEVAEAVGMSTRWVRDRIRFDGVEHLRYGRKIRFSKEQVELLRAAHVRQPEPQSVTTGRKKKATA